ncbi:MAG: S26 family signal peptidase [Luteibaculaceae bacterium]
MIPIILFFLILVSHLISLPKIFEKAGEKAWKGYVPFYNLYVWLKIMEKPWWWMLILAIPGVNFLLFMVMNYELSRAFDRKTLPFGILAFLAPFVAIPIIAFSNDKFVGAEKFEKGKKPASRDWAETIVFAVIAASIIRAFVLEAFTIPTPSMEKSLRVGDFLFVSKLSYGPRLPQTPLSFPFAHHTLPFTKATPSYLEWYSLPYLRLPGLGKVKRGDAIVFNFPTGDSVVVNMQETSLSALIRDYGDDVVRSNKLRNRDGSPVFGEIIGRPFDKTDHYIKRCVAVAGDELEIIDGLVYINGKKEEFPETALFSYAVFTEAPLNNKMLKDRYDLNPNEIIQLGANMYILTLTDDQYENLKQNSNVKSITKNTKAKGFYAENSAKTPIFPHHESYDWTEDNYGPLLIPAKGSSVNISVANLPIYQRVIEVYEKNIVEVKEGVVFINGIQTETYTFKQDYYFAMGDNRHRSADSRFWGFVPHELMVGKAVFVWFSNDPNSGIRWDRIFSRVKNG